MEGEKNQEKMKHIITLKIDSELKAREIADIVKKVNRDYLFFESIEVSNRKETIRE